MKILKKLLLVLGVAIVAVIGLALMQPDTFKLERSTVINAKAEKIYPYLSDFKGWDSWSPWAKLDPKMEKKLSGAAAGKGAMYEWSGDDKVGKGKMEILEADANKSVKIKLTFLEPFEAVNETLQTLTPEANGTKITWSMSGKNNLIGKIMCLFMNMDKMVGPDFEKGLANLKTLAEAAK